MYQEYEMGTVVDVVTELQDLFNNEFSAAQIKRRLRQLGLTVSRGGRRGGGRHAADGAPPPPLPPPPSPRLQGLAPPRFATPVSLKASGRSKKKAAQAEEQLSKAEQAGEGAAEYPLFVVIPKDDVIPEKYFTAF